MPCERLHLVTVTANLTAKRADAGESYPIVCDCLQNVTKRRVISL
jgi:hypothetical protein